MSAGSLRTATRVLALARFACAGAAIVLGWSVLRSFESAPLAGIAPVSRDDATADTGTVAITPAATITQLVARDPFSPVRSAPEVPYRIGVTPEVVAAVSAPVVQVRLLGTVVRAGAARSFAMCQVGEEPPRMVYPGQRVGTLVLESVMQGSAAFIDDAGARVVLRVARSGR